MRFQQYCFSLTNKQKSIKKDIVKQLSEHKSISVMLKLRYEFLPSVSICLNIK